MKRKNLIYSSVCGLLTIMLGACGWLPRAQPETPAPSLVDISSGGLLVSRSGAPELGLTLTNTSDQTLWVTAHFQTPDGLTDCILAKELETQAERFYRCPQSAIQADIDYPVAITVFAAREQLESVDSLTTSFRFSEADIQSLKDSSKP